MTIARDKIIKLLKDKKCNRDGIYLGHEIWVAADGSVIRMPNGNRIHIDLVEIIALESLNMGVWEYDYWLGQIGFNPGLN